MHSEKLYKKYSQQIASVVSAMEPNVDVVICYM